MLKTKTRMMMPHPNQIPQRILVTKNKKQQMNMLMV